MSVLEHIQRLASTGEDVLRSDQGLHLFTEIYDTMPSDFVVARRRMMARPLGAGIVQRLTVEYPTEQAIAIAQEADRMWIGEVLNSLEVSRPSRSKDVTASVDTSISMRLETARDYPGIPAIEWQGQVVEAVRSTDRKFWRQWGIVLRRTNESATSVGATTLPNFTELVEARLSEIE